VIEMPLLKIKKIVFCFPFKQKKINILNNMFLLEYKYLSIELDVFRILFLYAVARVTETKGVKMSSRSIFSPFLDGMKDYGHE
jgi:hypothetical protein